MSKFGDKIKSMFKKKGDDANNRYMSSASNDPENTESTLPDSDGIGSSPRKTLLIKKKKPWSLKKKIIVTVVSVISAILIGIAIFVISIIIDPLGGFKSVAQQMTSSTAPGPTTQTSSQASASATPTLDPYGKLISESDFSILESTVNILLIGVDHSPERDPDQKDWTGKHAYHSDVMIILAINTKTNEVNLISLPRDTYANIPDVEGIYKLNASIDCGGGWPTDSGFQKVCDAASWMIAGIPIQYYYAVDMTAVKELVNAIDGVDFDIDVGFQMQGRSYEAGFQHMDGQAVLDYLRVRKDKDIKGSSGTGDLNRINRQKNMLIAIFEKLKESGLLFKIPDILGAFDGNLYTNVPLAQTAGLAAYAYNVSSDNIKMQSLDGKYDYHLFDWNFVITDESKREELIKNIYGIDITQDEQFADYVSQYKNYSYNSANSLWIKMQKQVTEKQAQKVLDKVGAILKTDAKLPLEPTPSPSVSPSASPSASPSTSPSDSPSASPSASPSESPSASPSASPSDTDSADSVSISSLSKMPASGKYMMLSLKPSIKTTNYRKYLSDSEVWILYNKAKSELDQISSWSTSVSSKSQVTLFNVALSQLHTDIQSLANMFSISLSGKYWDVYFEDGSNQSYVENEIVVDFR